MSQFVEKAVKTFKDGTKEQQVIAAVAAGVTSLMLVNKAFGTDPIGKTTTLFKAFMSQENTRKINVNEMIDGYDNLHAGDSADDRNSAYTQLVNSYYELATLFYEWGWGQSFHFSYQLAGETFSQATARHEWYLAGRLGVKQGDKVLDCGCGVGGPMRNIARFTRANITGVTLNEYQVQRGNILNKEAGLADLAKSVQGDFMALSEKFEHNSFDGVYAIEATCHAPKREGVYGEIFKILKPGAVFATYEWCLTPKYDKDNEEHRIIKKKIEEGDGLPDMAYQAECVEALKNVGFEVEEARDMALDQRFGGDEWYLPLWPSWNPLSFRFQMNPIGKFITRNLLWIFEGLWLVPAGTYKVQEMLQQGGWGCAHGGNTGTFTPMWLMVARKPLR